MAPINSTSSTEVDLCFDARDINWLFPMSLIVSIISILMHSMILHAVFKRCDWLNTRYYIWTSLTIADLIIATLPVFFLPVLYTSSNPSTVQNLIKVVDFCLNFGMTSSLLNVTLLSLHRYFYCLRPFLSARLLTKSKVIGAVCASWITAATFSTGNLFSKSNHFTGSRLIVLRLSAVIQFSITIGSSIFVIIFVQCQLLISTLKKLQNEQLQRRVVARQNLKQNRRTKRLIPMIFIILIHICIFAPFLVALTLLTFGYDGSHQTVLNDIIDMLPFLSPLINSIIYGLQFFEVRRGIKKDLREIKRYILGRRLNQIEPEAASTTIRKTSRLFSFSYRVRITASGMPQLSEENDVNNNRISE